MHQILSFWKRILLQQPEVLNSEFTHGGWGNIRKNSEKLENRILCKQKTTENWIHPSGGEYLTRSFCNDVKVERELFTGNAHRANL